MQHLITKAKNFGYYCGNILFAKMRVTIVIFNVNFGNEIMAQNKSDKTNIVLFNYGIV